MLNDKQVRGALSGIVLCAQDPVGAWGGVQLLKDRYGLQASLVSGRVTDTPVGRRYCEGKLAVPAWNALIDGPEEVNQLVAKLLPTGVVS